MPKSNADSDPMISKKMGFSHKHKPDMDGLLSVYPIDPPGNEIDEALAPDSSLPETLDTEKTIVLPLEKKSLYPLATKTILYFCRFSIATLFVYEMLNFLKIIHHPLTYTWLGLAMTSLAIWFLLELIFSYTEGVRHQFVFSILMLAAIAGMYFDAIGDMLKFFDTIAWYDKVMHFFAGGITCGGIIFWMIKHAQDRGKIRLGPLTMWFFTWTATAFAGVLYELGEYFEDVLSGSHRLGDGFDTASDLFYGIIGGLIIATIMIIYFHSKKSKELKLESSSKKLS